MKSVKLVFLKLLRRPDLTSVFVYFFAHTQSFLYFSCEANNVEKVVTSFCRRRRTSPRKESGDFGGGRRGAARTASFVLLGRGSILSRSLRPLLRSGQVSGTNTELGQLWFRDLLSTCTKTMNWLAFFCCSAKRSLLSPQHPNFSKDVMHYQKLS